MSDLLLAARTAQKNGDLDHAVALARRARADAPQSPEPAFLLCRLLLEQRDAEANGLIETLDSFTGFAPGWEELGHALSPLHQSAARIAFRRAADAYAEMERRAPDAETAYRLGVVLHRLGQPSAAREAMGRALAHHPGHHGAWFTLGLASQDLQDGAAAERAFRAALAAKPDFHEAAFNLGVACQENGAMDEALDAYATAWLIRPESLGRVAQALVSPCVGSLWLKPSALRTELSARCHSCGTGDARARPDVGVPGEAERFECRQPGQP